MCTPSFLSHDTHELQELWLSSCVSTTPMQLSVCNLLPPKTIQGYSIRVDEISKKSHSLSCGPVRSFAIFGKPRVTKSVWRPLCGCGEKKKRTICETLNYPPIATILIVSSFYTGEVQRLLKLSLHSRSSVKSHPLENFIDFLRHVYHMRGYTEE